MAKENSSADTEGDLEDEIDRYRKEFDHPAYGDLPPFKDLMLKSLHNHYPEVDFSSIRIARELGFTHGLMMVAAEEYLRPAGLSWSKLFILLWLRAMQEEGKEGLNPSKLSWHLAVTRNTVSTLLAGLERQGYITRELDAEDKRRFVIRVTPAGSEAAQKCAAPLFHHLQEVFSSMAHEHKVALVSGLMELQRTLIQKRPDLAVRCPYPPLSAIEE
jgi:DNA-binding MarR family transcriptional regulator